MKQMSLHGNFRVSLDGVRETGEEGREHVLSWWRIYTSFLEIIENSVCNKIYQEPYFPASRLELGIA